MTADEWAQLSARIVAWWPATKWEPESFAIWFEDLEQHDAGVVRAALGELRQQPGAFAPSIGDVLSRLRSDPGRPTFDEMFALVFGPRGALSLQPPVRGRWMEGERAAAVRELVDEFLKDCHPLVSSFVRTMGVGKLRCLPVDEVRGDDGSDHGKWAKKQLRDAWDEHVRTWDGREVAAVAQGTDREGLRRVDPLAALGIVPRPELGA
jgi:hypothetical protein